MNGEPMDYHTLLPTHQCHCGGSHTLRSYPVGMGFVVAVCCARCRDRTGLPTRFSTETEPLHTLDAAEQSLKKLLKVGVAA